MAAAARIQAWYRRRNVLYYSTLRIVARYQLAYKVSIGRIEPMTRASTAGYLIATRGWFDQ